MTLILGLICKDGIVVAADSQLSMGDLKKTSVEKIKQCGFCLWAGAGAVSEIQAIEKAIASLPTENREKAHFDGLANNIKQFVHNQRKNSVRRYMDIYGGMIPVEIPACDILLCGHDNTGKQRLGIITTNGDLVEFDDYVAIGIGRPFAQVLLKNLKLNDLIKNITAEEGKVFLYKVIKAAIETGSYGMDFPIFLWEIKIHEGIPQLHKCLKEEVIAIEDVVETVERLEQEIFQKVRSVTGTHTETKNAETQSPGTADTN